MMRVIWSAGATVKSENSIWKVGEPLKFIYETEPYIIDKVEALHMVMSSDLSRYIKRSNFDDKRNLFGNHLCCGEEFFFSTGFSLEREKDSIFEIELEGRRGVYTIIEGLDLANVPNIQNCLEFDMIDGMDYEVSEVGRLEKSSYEWKVVSKCKIL